MNDHHTGKIFNYNADLYEVEENKDPNEKMTFISRLALDDCPEVRRFELPNDNTQGLCLDKSTIAAVFTIPSNFVPDNDVLSKGIAKVDMTVENSKIFSSFDSASYYLYSHGFCKLNKSPLAQEIDSFTTGRFDSFDVDADALTKTRLHSNGLNLVENRQQYAKPIWKDASGYLQANSKTGSKLMIPFKRLFHEYQVRAPFMHGFAKQPRLIPPHVKVKVEFKMNEQGHTYLQHTKYQICRANKQLIQKMDYKYSPSLELEESYGKHTTEASCDCLAKLESGEVTSLDEILVAGKVPYDDVKGEEYYKKLSTKATWRQHEFTKLVPKLTTIPGEELKAEEDQEIYFGIERSLDPTELFNPSEFVFESVFKDPENNERPISNGKKHESFIPFYNPDFQRIELAAGRQDYTLQFSSGIKPKSIMLTGIPYSRKAPSFQICNTKTMLHWPKFRIKEFSIFQNDKPHNRTPFTNDYQHYTHFLQQTGAWQEKETSGINFFQFRDQNWMVPLLFDDATGEPATLKVRIKFDQVLEENYDLLVIRNPYQEVLLNSETRRK
jgi:hypothetical protein